MGSCSLALEALLRELSLRLNYWIQESGAWTLPKAFRLSISSFFFCVYGLSLRRAPINVLAGASSGL